MSNSDLTNKTYNVPESLQKYIGKTLSYPNVKMIKSRLSKAKSSNIEEFNKKGGDSVLNWCEQSLSNDRNTIHSVKKTGMDAGRENEFIKTHEKDVKNSNPTGIGGVPDMTKGDVSRKIMSNKEVFNEAIDIEIKKIRYLIEYMHNNKKK